MDSPKNTNDKRQVKGSIEMCGIVLECCGGLHYDDWDRHYEDCPEARGLEWVEL